MAEMFESQGMVNPQMMDMMSKMDMSQDKVNAQFQELGLKPEDVINKVRGNASVGSFLLFGDHSGMNAQFL
jgi:hypothetical protein